MFCPACGKQIEETDRFCMSCGHNLRRGETIKDIAQADQPTASTSVDKSPPIPEISPHLEPLAQSKPFVIDAEKLADATQKKPKKPNWLVVSILLLASIGALSGTVLPEYDGTNKDPKSWGYLSIWIGGLTAYYGYLRGKSGWRYFFFGLIGGSVLSALLIAGIGFLTHGASRVEGMLLKMPVYQALKTSDPETYDILLKQFREGARNNESKEQILARTQPILSKVTHKFVPLASDHSLISYFQTQINYAETIFSVNPELCYETMITKKKRAPLELIPEVLRRQELDALAEVIRTGGAGRAPARHPDTEPILDDLMSKLAKKYGKDIELLHDPLASGVNKGRTCEVMIALYNEIIKLPSNQAASVIRYAVAN